MLTHKGTAVIKTERLILRRFTPDDAQNMYDGWAKDERVTCYVTWQPHKSPEETRQLLESWCAAYDRPNTYNWAIELDDKPIGSIGAVNINERDESAELGYCMGYDHWNKGLMTEAAGAVIDYLFTEIGLHRVEIRHAVKNPGSGRVAQKCGLTHEGTMREKFKSASGEYLDIAYYAILRSEWKKSREGKV